MRSLTKILLAAILIAGTGYSTANPHPTVKVSASEIVDRHLSGFNAVNVAGPFDVDIIQGTTESVKVVSGEQSVVSWGSSQPKNHSQFTTNFLN